MKKTVLICDDDADILEVTRTVLELKGITTHTITTCNNIIEAVDKFKPALILMDLWVPDSGGAVATKLLKSTPHTAAIPVILFSANNNIENVAAQCGADDFLRKPYDIEELENIVEKFLKA